MTKIHVNINPVPLFDEDEDLVLDILCKDAFGPLLRGHGSGTSIDKGSWKSLLTAVHPQAVFACGPEFVSFNDNNFVSNGKRAIKPARAEFDVTLKSSARLYWTNPVASHVSHAFTDSTESTIKPGACLVNQRKLGVAASNLRSQRFYGGGNAEDLASHLHGLRIVGADEFSDTYLSGILGADLHTDTTVFPCRHAGASGDAVSAGGDNNYYVGRDGNYPIINSMHNDIICTTAGDNAFLSITQSDCLRASEEACDGVHDNAQSDCMPDGAGRDILHGGRGVHMRADDAVCDVIAGGGAANDMFIFHIGDEKEELENWMTSTEGSDQLSPFSETVALLFIGLGMSVDDLKHMRDARSVLLGSYAAMHHVDLAPEHHMPGQETEHKSGVAGTGRKCWKILNTRAASKRMHRLYHTAPGATFCVIDMVSDDVIDGQGGTWKSSFLSEAIRKWAVRNEKGETIEGFAKSGDWYGCVVDGAKPDSVGNLMTVLRNVMHASKSHN